MHDLDFQGSNELKQDINSSSGHQLSRGVIFGGVVLVCELQASGRFV